MSDKKSTYPMLSDKSWTTLRERFKNSVPRAGVTPTYLMSALGDMGASSANNNVIRPLRILGLIDSQGMPTERALRWRDDSQYATVCDEILNEVYPTELLDVLPPPSPDRAGVVRWFASHNGSGTGAATKMASTYLTIAAADPSGNARERAKKPAQSGGPKPIRNPKDAKTPFRTSLLREPSNGVRLPKPDTDVQDAKLLPSLHIDLQIHISPDATIDQIDQVFASMAKHLYRGKPEA